MVREWLHGPWLVRAPASSPFCAPSLHVAHGGQRESTPESTPKRLSGDAQSTPVSLPGVITLTQPKVPEAKITGSQKGF